MNEDISEHKASNFERKRARKAHLIVELQHMAQETISGKDYSQMNFRFQGHLFTHIKKEKKKS